MSIIELCGECKNKNSLRCEYKSQGCLRYFHSKILSESFEIIIFLVMISLCILLIRRKIKSDVKWKSKKLIFIYFVIATVLCKFSTNFTLYIKLPLIFFSTHHRIFRARGIPLRNAKSFSAGFQHPIRAHIYIPYVEIARHRRQ